MLDVRCFRGAGCDTDHSLVVAKARERLAVSKQAAQKFEGERFNLNKLKEPEVRKQYQIKNLNRFAASKNLSDGEDINRAREDFTVNIKTPTKESLGLHELKQLQPFFHEECLRFLDRMKRAKM